MEHGLSAGADLLNCLDELHPGQLNCYGQGAGWFCEAIYGTASHCNHSRLLGALGIDKVEWVLEKQLRSQLFGMLSIDSQGWYMGRYKLERWASGLVIGIEATLLNRVLREACDPCW